MNYIHLTIEAILILVIVGLVVFIVTNRKRMQSFTLGKDGVSFVMSKENDNRLESIYIGMLKLRFYSEALALGERMLAGMEYIAAGHNSAMKADVIGLCENNISMYNALVLCHPEWSIDALEKGGGDD